MSISRRAMEKFLPLLEAGVSYPEARKQLYSEKFEAGPPIVALPLVAEALSDVRNPAISRSLTELRKVVNAILREYGRPVQIHLELARDLKKSKKQRARITETNRNNERSRQDAAKKVMAEAGITKPSRDDIRKYQLAEECRWQCPYTGLSISMGALFGPEPQFDIEHIIPFSRSLDNSYLNVTLCHVPENRNVKGNKTPHEGYSGNIERCEQIISRLNGFTGERHTVAEKLRRFRLDGEGLEKFLSDFRERQLNDTAYATILAKRYIGLLYGGEIDADGTRRVQASSGQPTAYLRGLWKLNTILTDGPTTNGGRIPKSRTDHRHHAVDAVVIALTDAGMIKRLSDAAQRAPLEHHRRFASLEAPWPNFVDSVRTEIDRITVSHRVSKKVSGPLHEETIYSRRLEVAAVPPPQNSSRRSQTAATEVRVRKLLTSVTKSELNDIADEGVRKLVIAKLEAFAGAEPKKVFADEKNLPFFETKEGRRIPIKRVRLKKKTPTITLGEGRRTRQVTLGSNHHIEIFAEVDDRGEEVEWDGAVVSMFEAHQRKKSGQPIVQKTQGKKRRFIFSLAPDEVIECDDKKGSRSLFVMRKVSHLSSGGITIGFAPVRDARKAREMQVARDWLWLTPNTLRDRHSRKVIVSPLGEVSPAND